LRVPVLAGDMIEEWNKLAAEQQRLSMEQTRRMSENLAAAPVNNAMRPPLPEYGADRMVPLDTEQPGEVYDLSQRKPRKVRILTPLERA
jgi:hypothetical protein